MCTYTGIIGNCNEAEKPKSKDCGQQPLRQPNQHPLPTPVEINTHTGARANTCTNVNFSKPTITVLPNSVLSFSCKKFFSGGLMHYLAAV